MSKSDHELPRGYVEGEGRAATTDPLVAHLRVENNRLRAELEAERSYTRRADQAIGLLRAAAEMGRTALNAYGRDEESENVSTELDDSKTLIERADELVLPTAKE